MKSLPKRSYVSVALVLLCGFGLCEARPIRGLAAAPETVIVSTLDVRSDSPSVTRVQLQSTARLDYNVSKPEPHLVSIDLYGADTSALQPEYRAEQGLVASVVVKSGLIGQATSRLEITLREPCEVRSYLRNDARSLVIEFEPATKAPAAGVFAGEGGVQPKASPSSESVVAGPPAAREALPSVVQPVTFSRTGASRATKSTNAKLPSLKSVTLAKLDDATIAELGLTARPKYNHFVLQNPSRLVIDLFDAAAAVEKRTISGDDSLVSRVRVGEPDGRTTRVVFDLRQSVPYTVSESESGLVVRFAGSPARASVGAAVASEPGASTSSSSAMPAANGVVTDASVEKSVGTPTLQPTASASPASKADASEAPTPKRLTSARPEPAALTVPPARSASAGASTETSAKEKAAKVKPTSEAASSAPAHAPSPTTGRRPQGGRGAQFGDPSYQGDPVSLDITNVDLSDILRFISDNYDVNFVLDKSVGKVPVTLKVNQVPWTQVLESILRANQLTYRREGMIVRVATVAAITAEEQNRRNQRLQEIYSAPTVTEYFKLKYERVDQNAAQQQAAGGVALQSPSG
ncbi:MAG: AMIN domain-containing protein, partial [Chloracidobacterium sp.]